MRRNDDDLLRGFLALNALLREELRDVRRLFQARATETREMEEVMKSVRRRRT